MFLKHIDPSCRLHNSSNNHWPEHCLLVHRLVSRSLYYSLTLILIYLRPVPLLLSNYPSFPTAFFLLRENMHTHNVISHHTQVSMYMFAMANDRRREGEGEIRELVVIDGWDKTMTGNCNRERERERESEKEFAMLRMNQRKRHTCDRSREKESEARNGRWSGRSTVLLLRRTKRHAKLGGESLTAEKRKRGNQGSNESVHTRLHHGVKWQI